MQIATLPMTSKLYLNLLGKKKNFLQKNFAASQKDMKELK